MCATVALRLWQTYYHVFFIQAIPAIQILGFTCDLIWCPLFEESKEITLGLLTKLPFHIVQHLPVFDDDGSWSLLIFESFIFFCQFQTWSVIGKLPYRIKTTLTGFWDGWLYFTSGQRDRGPENPQPRKVIGEMWRTKLHLW